MATDVVGVVVVVVVVVGGGVFLLAQLRTRSDEQSIRPFTVWHGTMSMRHRTNSYTATAN